MGEHHDHEDKSWVSIMTEPGESTSVRPPSTVPIDALKAETSVYVHLSNSPCQSAEIVSRRAARWESMSPRPSVRW